MVRKELAFVMQRFCQDYRGLIFHLFSVIDFRAHSISGAVVYSKTPSKPRYVFFRLAV
jgi:hypothetical protein